MATCEQSQSSTTEESEKGHVVSCSMCADVDKSSPARHYCVDCELYLCGKCVKYHSKFPATKSHQVNDVASSDMTDVNTEPEIQGRVAAVTLKCLVHRDKILSTFCKDHDEVCCDVCALVKHRLVIDLLLLFSLVV